MREFDSVVKFAETAPELYEAMKIYFHNEMAEAGAKGYATANESKDVMEKAINKAYFEEIQRRSGYTLDNFDGDMKRFSNSVVIKQFANDIRDFMIDMILPETLLNSTISAFADFRFADLGDSMSFNIENNALYTVSKAGYRLRTTNMQKLYGTTVTLVPENHMLTVGTDLFDYLTGRASIAKDVMKAARSIETAMLFDAYDAFDAAMEGLTGGLTVTNYSERGLLTLCETVSAYNQGRKAVILGTPVALKSVLPSNTNYRYLLDSDYVRIGHLPTFNDYDVIPMVQVANPYDAANPYALKLRDDRIYVVSPASDKLVKIGIGGSLVSHTDAIYDNANLLQMSTLSKAWDTQVITNSTAGVIKIQG